MDYQGNWKLGSYNRCKCGYADFRDWGTICDNCGDPKKPESPTPQNPNEKRYGERHNGPMRFDND